MDKKKKRVQIFQRIMIALCLIIAAGILVYMGQSDSFSFALGTKEKSHLRIGIVNQDDGAQLNGSQYNFGEEFTNLLTRNEGEKASWKVMSRNQAESQYNDNSLEAIIYVPKDFSHSVLQFKSFNPERAKITYKVKNSVRKEQTLEMSQQVGEYVNVLNKEMIRLYFTSVINNLDDTKRQMNTIVGDETDTYNALTTSIYQPAEQSIQSLGSITSIAEGVQSSNQSFERSTASFKDSTANLLKNNVDTLFKQADSILQYENIQSQVVNHNVKVVNGALQKQYDVDKNFYLNLYNHSATALYLFGHKSQDSQDNTESYLRLLTLRIADYNNKINTYQEQLKQSKKDIETVKTSLEKARSQVSQNYFNGQEVDTTSLGEDEKAILKAINDAVDQKSVKQALAMQVMHTFSKRAELPLDYTNQVNSTIASISVRAGDYTALFNKLKAMGALSDEQINSYNAKLNLLEKYASVKGATTGTIPSYSFINVENDNLPSTVSKTFAMDSVYPEMKSGDNKENKYVATSVRVTNIRSQGAQNVAVTPSVNSISEPTSIQFQLQFTPNYGVNTVEFDVEIGNEKIPMQYTFFYDNNKANTALVKENLSSILGHLSRIDTAATTVKNLYGSPNSSYDIDVATPANDSVAKMYGRLSPASIVDRLAEADVNNYRQSGIALYGKLSKEINQLQKTIDNLPHFSKEDLPTNYFEKNLSEITNWYQTTSDELNAQYEKWKKNGPVLLEASSTTSGNNLSDSRVYTTDDTNNQLYKTVMGLASSTQKASDTVTTTGNAIGSMETQFSSLTEQAKRVQGDVNKVHRQTDSLVKAQAKNIENANAFNKNFQGVLSNARSNGTDNQAVLNFLSNPIASEELKQSGILKNTPIWIYFVLILILTNIATAITMKQYSHRKEMLPVEDEEHFE